MSQQSGTPQPPQPPRRRFPKISRPFASKGKESSDSLAGLESLTRAGLDALKPDLSETPPAVARPTSDGLGGLSLDMEKMFSALDSQKGAESGDPLMGFVAPQSNAPKSAASDPRILQSAAFLPRDAKSRPAKIKVIGVGGAGTNSVESMLRMGLDGVDFMVANTDAQALAVSSCPLRLQIGADITNGLGAGADPEVGAAAAEASLEPIQAFLEGADMVFITAGMGGGTGTGAAPVIARAAREMDILSAAICTKPFRFEGSRRMERALGGLEKLGQHADTMIVVSNDKLLSSVGPKTSLVDAFQLANTVLAHGVSAISDIVNHSGMVNVDFADVCSILSGSGDAIMGIGRAQGEQRAVNAVRKACQSPLLEKLVIDGAGGILISIVGGKDLCLHEVSEAIGLISGAASRDADIIFGAAIDPNMGEEVKATVLATRFTEDAAASRASSSNAASALLDQIGGEAFALGGAPEPRRREGGNSGAASKASSTPSLDDLLGLGLGDDMPAGKKGSAPANDAGAPVTGEEEDDEFDLPAYLRRRRRRRFF
jgi:cell division protein FtsZ